MSKEVAKKKNLPEDGQKPDEILKVEELLKSTNPNIFQGVRKEKKEEILSSLVVIRRKIHEGPLPDPETLDHYNNLIPNGAERIMIMAEKQQNHRHELDNIILPKQVKQSARGQWFGFILGGIALICGGILTYLGHDIIGGIIFSATVISLTTVFVIGKNKQKE